MIKRLAMLSFFTILCLKTMLFSIAENSAIPDSKPDEGELSDFEGAFKIKNWGETKTPELKDDTRNVRREKLSTDDLDNTIKEAQGSLSNEVKIKEKLKWQPLWKYEGLGGVNLPSIAISDDNSLIAIVERTGEIKGPNGSRIIIMRTSDFTILRIHELKEKKIEKALFIPSDKKLILSSSKQPEIKQSNEIILFDFDLGSAVNSRRLKKSVTDFIQLENFIIALFEPEPGSNIAELLALDADNLETKKSYSTSNSSGIMADSLSYDGNFVFAGNNKIEIFSISKPDAIQKLVPPEKGTPSSVAYIPGKSVFFVIYQEKGAYVFKDGVPRKIMSFPDSAILYSEEEDLLLISSLKGDRTVFFKPPDFEETDNVSFSSLKPKTKGDTIFIARLDKENYMFLDSQGSIYTCVKKGKRWKKALIIEAMK